MSTTTSSAQTACTLSSIDEESERAAALYKVTKTAAEAGYKSTYDIAAVFIHKWGNFFGVDITGILWYFIPGGTVWLKLGKASQNSDRISKLLSSKLVGLFRDCVKTLEAEKAAAGIEGDLANPPSGCIIKKTLEPPGVR